MNISELIDSLKKARKKYGDCKVYNNICGSISEDLCMVYGENIYCNNYDNGLTTNHNGIFLNFIVDDDNEI